MRYKRELEDVTVKIELTYTCKGQEVTTQATRYDIHSSVSECELCGEHGSTELMWPCKVCGRYHEHTLRSW